MAIAKTLGKYRFAHKMATLLLVTPGPLITPPTQPGPHRLLHRLAPTQLDDQNAVTAISKSG